MQKCLGNCLSMFAEGVTEKINEVEQRAGKLESDMKTVQENMVKLQIAADKTGEVDLVALQKQVIALQERVDHQVAGPAPTSPCMPSFWCL